ncbi:MAG: hydantoinase/oxoprolinase family protein [Chloroflexota bacterium]|nr:hydantoinase/oxoprolinase family protein [Chloroflexota bacterium]
MEPRTNQSAAVEVGIDIGGTFTDFLLVDPTSGAFAVHKALTTPRDPSEAVLTGLRDLLAQADVRGSDVRRIVHGTTLVTNALIERKGAVTGLITTKGFRDAVEIGREHRYDLYDLFIDLPQPLVPRYLRLEIDERTFSDGTIQRPVNPEEVRQRIDQMRAQGVQAVAVSLLHSYQNAESERQVAAVLDDYAPDLIYSLSSDVVPEIREFERTSTTIANVYTRPIVAEYLRRLEDSLADLGINAPLFVMISAGGLSTVETARRYPIRLVESGPAAGAIAAAWHGERSGRANLLSFDMGGTTAKACLVDDNRPSISPEFEVNRVYRFKKGSGLPIRVPVVELIEIGAGGGSIARVDAMGLLKVGPESAGAEPGPVCYGRGGTQPTVTDADLLLGYLNPDYFLGGGMNLDLAGADAALVELGRQIDKNAIETAWGIHAVVNEQMASAARMHAVEQGKDHTKYPMYAFGGAGPVHAYRVAEILGSPEVIIPFGAGVGSTIGFLVAPIAFDFVRSYVSKLETAGWSIVNNRLQEMQDDGRRILAGAGVAEHEITFERTAELRYVGQGHDVTVSLPEGELSGNSRPEIERRFEEEYTRLYGRTPSGNPVEAMTWRVIARATNSAGEIRFGAVSRSESQNVKPGRREIYLPEERAKVPVPVYSRYELPVGFQFEGPAVIEERESTTIVGPHSVVTVDQERSLVVTMPAKRA